MTDQAVLDFLATRRSHSPKVLTAPVPTRDQLESLLDLAARSPDHGALAPWRFIVVEKTAMVRLADLAEERARALGRAIAATSPWSWWNRPSCPKRCRRVSRPCPPARSASVSLTPRWPLAGGRAG